MTVLQAEKICPHCAEMVKSEANVCKYCHYAFTKFCPHCAETIKSEAKICRFCYEDVSEKSSIPPASSVNEKQVNWYLEAWRKYGVFSGRARRKEYWIFVICNLFIWFALAIFETAVTGTDSIVLATIFQLATLTPSYAVSVRRLHDTNHSGWWLLVPFANIILLFSDGTAGENHYGPDSKARF